MDPSIPTSNPYGSRDTQLPNYISSHQPTNVRCVRPKDRCVMSVEVTGVWSTGAGGGRAVRAGAGGGADGEVTGADGEVPVLGAERRAGAEGQLSP